MLDGAYIGMLLRMGTPFGNKMRFGENKGIAAPNYHAITR
jgi:hypothetical protein